MWDSLRTRLRRWWRVVSGHPAEILTAAAWLTGWALVTWGVAELLELLAWGTIGLLHALIWNVAGPRPPIAPIAWATSSGLLLLSLGGWRLLRTVVVEGLYALSEREQRRR